jgi:hypothetical protein
VPHHRSAAARRSALQSPGAARKTHGGIPRRHRSMDDAAERPRVPGHVDGGRACRVRDMQRWKTCSPIRTSTRAAASPRSTTATEHSG